jgi:hypothetical protein
LEQLPRKTPLLGPGALGSNPTSGTYNSAFGFFSLFNNISGAQNTGLGALTLLNNTTGSANTAIGLYSLVNNTTGFENTAIGFETLAANKIGFQNTATGTFSLTSNLGSQNTGYGRAALESNTTGGANTASGASALQNSTTGSGNIGLGAFAGFSIVAGSNNIDIGDSGLSDESDTIRIGTNNVQNQTFIAGISSTGVTGTAVVVASNGQLGIALSSARYKRDISDLGDASASLMKLRPVTFRYKNDPTSTLQYGLVAEEVQRVYPELVTRGNDGKAQSVRYLEFTALLLNELQKLSQKLERKDAQLNAQQHEIDVLKQKEAAINALSERLQVLERQAHTLNPDRLGSLARE